MVMKQRTKELSQIGGGYEDMKTKSTVDLRWDFEAKKYINRKTQ